MIIMNNIIIIHCCRVMNGCIIFEPDKYTEHRILISCGDSPLFSMHGIKGLWFQHRY